MNKLIFTDRKDAVVSYLFENDKAIEIGVHEKEASILNNVYVGRVTNIVKNIGAAFVDIENGISCYLSIEDNKNPLFLNNKNSDKICINDILLVQVKREAIKSKCPMVTTEVEFAGKYAVLIYGRKGINVSSKIKDEDTRMNILEAIKEYKSDDYALIARTNCENADISNIKKDCQFLIERINKILETARYSKSGICIYRGPSNYLLELNNYKMDYLEEIITDSENIYNALCEYSEMYLDEIKGLIRFYQDDYSLSKLYGLEKILDDALKKHIWLKSGGSIVIEHTETLTSIDVNTEKAIMGKKTAQETFFKINMEAAIEIARQIRLRNISGIIIIDFIDLEDNDKKKQLVEHFKMLIKDDPVKTCYIDITGLNLMEVTRKKVKSPLYEKKGLL